MYQKSIILKRRHTWKWFRKNKERYGENFSLKITHHCHICTRQHTGTYIACHHGKYIYFALVYMWMWCKRNCINDKILILILLYFSSNTHTLTRKHHIGTYVMVSCVWEHLLLILYRVNNISLESWMNFRILAKQEYDNLYVFTDLTSFVV